MEDSFGINNVALVEGQPRTLGLRELLQVYRRPPARGRAPPLGVPPAPGARSGCTSSQGLLVAIVDIDEVIQLIRSSDDAAAARRGSCRCST